MKFLTICLIAIGIIIIFNAGGVVTPTGGFVFAFLNGGLATFKQSIYWTALKITLITGIGGGITASLLGRAPPESFLIGSLVATLGGAILADMLSVFIIIWGVGDVWIRWVATAIFIPLVIGFVLSMISFWRGSDG